MALATFNPNHSELLKKRVECMGDSQGLVRLSLAETLGSIGKPATPFLLEALAHHPNPVVRRASAKTLTLICEAIARTTLLEAFLYDEDRVGGGRVGLKTKPAVSSRACTDKTHSKSVKEFLLDRALTFSSQNESISIVAKQKSNESQTKVKLKTNESQTKNKRKQRKTEKPMHQKRANPRKTHAPNLAPQPP